MADWVVAAWVEYIAKKTIYCYFLYLGYVYIIWVMVVMFWYFGTCVMLMLCCVVFVLLVLWQSGRLTCREGQCYEARSPHDQARWGGRWWWWGGGRAALKTDRTLLSPRPGGDSGHSTPPNCHWIYFTITMPVWGPVRALPLWENTSSVSASERELWWCVTSSVTTSEQELSLCCSVEVKVAVSCCAGLLALLMVVVLYCMKDQ